VSTDSYRLSAELLQKLRALSERRLSREEVVAALQVPISDSEREGILELIAWFRRRYPTPVDRLRYVRRAYRRWQSAQERADPRPQGKG
jgi:hypothetical protein